MPALRRWDSNESDTQAGLGRYDPTSSDTSEVTLYCSDPTSTLYCSDEQIGPISDQYHAHTDQPIFH